MSNIEKVGQQASKTKGILCDFLTLLSEKEQIEFRAAFHIRPTSTGNSTIISTLPIAPMRGLKVQNNELNTKLEELRKTLGENDDKKLEILEDKGFNERKSASHREEDAQAALIRDLILNPKEYNHLQFVASEFELFGYGDKADKTKRPDVLAFDRKNGVLFDIELKNERLTETVKQASGYVKHIKDHLSEYSECLYQFPNCSIESIKTVKGIALVPYSEKSGGGLEKASKELDIELWFFAKQFQIIKGK